MSAGLRGLDALYRLVQSGQEQDIKPVGYHSPQSLKMRSEPIDALQESQFIDRSQ